MAQKTCDLGHLHTVCDRCGNVNRTETDDDGAQVTRWLESVRIVLGGGGELWRATLCDRCMYDLRDIARAWMTGSASMLSDLPDGSESA